MGVRDGNLDTSNQAVRPGAAFQIGDYCRAITDRIRFDAYARALERLVTTKSIVLNVDAGVGMTSFVACQLGARRCYAIDSSTAIQTLVEAVRENDVADRIVVLQRRPSEVSAIERADIIVSDVPGTLSFPGGHLANLLDARARFLAPNGRMLPETDTLWLAVVSTPDTFASRHRLERTFRGLKLQSLQRLMDNRCYEHRARPTDLLCSPVQWARIDYATFTGVGLRGSMRLTIPRAATAHGLLAWHDSSFGHGIAYSNAPGAREGDYSQTLFPWPEAVTFAAGDVVDVEMRADAIGSDYVWTWTTQIRKRTGATGARFRQSTFLGRAFSPDSIRKRVGNFVPVLSTEGRVVLDVLTSMRAGKDIVTLAKELFAAQPSNFGSLDDAHGFVAALSERYSM